MTFRWRIAKRWVTNPWPNTHTGAWWNWYRYLPTRFGQNTVLKSFHLYSTTYISMNNSESIGKWQTDHSLIHVFGQMPLETLPFSAEVRWRFSEPELSYVSAQLLCGFVVSTISTMMFGHLTNKQQQSPQKSAKLLRKLRRTTHTQTTPGSQNSLGLRMTSAARYEHVGSVVTFGFNRNIGCASRDIHDFLVCSCSATIEQPQDVVT